MQISKASCEFHDKHGETFLRPACFFKNNMNFPPCHEESPQYAAWNSRVESLEEAGLDRSDAQGIADLEFSQIKN
jgi:hypothetical protein